MPAWGTVTMWPGCSTMLLEVSPVSKMRLRVAVMMFARGGGTGSGASGARGSVTQADRRRIRVRERIGFRASDDGGVAGVVGDAASLSENFDQGNLAISLVDHRVRHGAHDGYGLAFAFLDRHADVRV